MLLLWDLLTADMNKHAGVSHLPAAASSFASISIETRMGRPSKWEFITAFLTKYHRDPLTADETGTAFYLEKSKGKATPQLLQQKETFGVHSPIA
jgi:hypothetical protein